MRGGRSDLKEQADALGVVLPPEELEPDDFEVEPECWDSVVMFARVSTQWRMGSDGPVGLDLSVALSLGSLLGMRPEAQIEMVDDLAIMERTWLEALRNS